MYEFWAREEFSGILENRQFSIDFGYGQSSKRRLQNNKYFQAQRMGRV